MLQLTGHPLNVFNSKYQSVVTECINKEKRTNLQWDKKYKKKLKIKKKRGGKYTDQMMNASIRNVVIRKNANSSEPSNRIYYGWGIGKPSRYVIKKEMIKGTLSNEQDGCQYYNNVISTRKKYNRKKVHNAFKDTGIYGISVARKRKPIPSRNVNSRRGSKRNGNKVAYKNIRNMGIIDRMFIGEEMRKRERERIKKKREKEKEEVNNYYDCLSDVSDPLSENESEEKELKEIKGVLNDEDINKKEKKESFIEKIKERPASSAASRSSSRRSSTSESLVKLVERPKSVSQKGSRRSSEASIKSIPNKLIKLRRRGKKRCRRNLFEIGFPLHPRLSHNNYM